MQTGELNKKTAVKSLPSYPEQNSQRLKSNP